MTAKRLMDWLVYLVVRIFICVIQSLRLETCQVVSRWLAFVAADVVRLRGQVVDENVQSVFPKWTGSRRRELTREMWEHLFLMVCEIAHAPRRIHRRNWHQHLSFSDKRSIVKWLFDPRPTVLVSAHFGNFEMGSFISGLLGFPTFVIARQLDNPYLDAFVARFRRANGQYLLPKDGSARQVQQVLDNGWGLALLGDQHAGPKGCWVDFLGRPASCHKAIALFTLTSGAPLLVLAALRERNQPLQFSCEMLDSLDPKSSHPACANVATLTQWYNDALGNAIRAHPQQYWWVHRRWKGDPPKGRAARSHAA